MGTLHFWWDILVVLMDPPTVVALVALVTPTLVALVTLVAPTLVVFSAGSPFFNRFFRSIIWIYKW